MRVPRTYGFSLFVTITSVNVWHVAGSIRLRWWSIFIAVLITPVSMAAWRVVLDVAEPRRQRQAGRVALASARRRRDRRRAAVPSREQDTWAKPAVGASTATARPWSREAKRFIGADCREIDSAGRGTPESQRQRARVVVGRSSRRLTAPAARRAPPARRSCARGLRGSGHVAGWHVRVAGAPARQRGVGFAQSWVERQDLQLTGVIRSRARERELLHDQRFLRHQEPRDIRVAALKDVIWYHASSTP